MPTNSGSERFLPHGEPVLANAMKAPADHDWHRHAKDMAADIAGTHRLLSVLVLGLRSIVSTQRLAELEFARQACEQVLAQERRVVEQRKRDSETFKEIVKQHNKALLQIRWLRVQICPL
jgi:hypothetical protein